MLKNINKYLSNVTYTRLKHLRRNYSAQKYSSEWKSTIGLEIHAQLSIASKLFSGGSSWYSLNTNSGVNMFDASIPGTLPVLNKKAVELAVLTALALKCKINPVSLFDRKHYFYADLPNGYQITQQRLPLATNGVVDFTVFNSAVHKKPFKRTTKIKQIQLEQDSGKSYHNDSTRESCIDLNRAGIALIEIVFEPDLEDAEEAAALVKELCFILVEAGTCSCKMEEGALRVDANVSVHKEGMGLGVRTEVKNINTIRGVAQAINYEISRQLNVIKSGGTVSNQTLAWDSVEGKTVVLRDKEELHDYRFMPEPNLPPLRLMINDGEENIHATVRNKERILDLRHLRNKIFQLPEEKRNILLEKYKTSDLVAYNIVNKPKLYDYFTEIMTEKASRNASGVYHVLLTVLLKVLYKFDMDVTDCTIPAEYLGELVDLRENIITDRAIEVILEDILKGSKLRPKEIVEKKNLATLSDDEIKEICFNIMTNNPKAVGDYVKGKQKVLKFFVRNVVQETNSKVTSARAEKIVTEILEAKKSGKL